MPMLSRASKLIGKEDLSTGSNYSCSTGLGNVRQSILLRLTYDNLRKLYDIFTLGISGIAQFLSSVCTVSRLLPVKILLGPRRYALFTVCANP